MPALEWSDALSLDLPMMDTTHQEFVELLAVVEAASDADLLPAWQQLVDHTDDHFGREDRWMADTRFASSNCHSTQHHVVLQIMQDGAAKADRAMVRQMARELAVWFPQHAQAMDAALALHMRRVGYDPLTGIVHAPESLPREEIQGCGGVTCSDSEAAEVAA
jgi:hemerythrin-like metal-binding protein